MSATPEQNNAAAIARAKDAETILMPKNGNEDGARDWLETVAGIEVPHLSGRRLTVRNEGRLFRRLRDPEIADGVARGEGDIGFLGLDKFRTLKLGGLSLVGNGLALDYVGDVEGCDFVLAAQADAVDEVQRKLKARQPVDVITSHAAWLEEIGDQRGWELAIREVSGATEAYAGYASMIADLRVTGESLRQNGWEEFNVLDSVHLGQVYMATPETIA